MSFFRRFVGGEITPGERWTGVSTPDSILPARTAVSYMAPDTPADRMDIARFVRPGDLTTNHLGGDITVTDMGVYGWCSNVYDTPCVPGREGGYDIHRSWSWFGPVGPGLQEGVLGWSTAAEGNASVTFELPFVHRDVSGYDVLAFRTMMNPGYDANHGVDYQDFDIVLEDTNGDRVSVGAADVGNDVLGVQLEGRRRPSGHLIMNQIRFPLADFQGVDFVHIRSVTFAFDRRGLPAGWRARRPRRTAVPEHGDTGQGTLALDAARRSPCVRFRLRLAVSSVVRASAARLLRRVGLPRRRRGLLRDSSRGRLRLRPSGPDLHAHSSGEQSGYAARLKTYLAGRFRHFVKFGAGCMEAREYETRLQEALAHYYRFLAKSLVSPGSREVLAYHRSALEQAGYPFSWKKLVAVVFPYWGYAIRHPGEALRLLLRLPGTVEASPRIPSVPQSVPPTTPSRPAP